MEKNYLADNIYYLRKKSKMSQEQFGRQLGLSKSCISMYEKKARSPSIDDAFRLADFFGLRVADLLTVDLENSKGYIAVHSDDLPDFDEKDVKMIAAILKAVKEK